MRVYPVIHHVDYPTTIVQVAIAAECKADGVFLISHNGQDGEILSMASEVRNCMLKHVGSLGAWVGINLLSEREPNRALAHSRTAGFDGTWIDAPGVTSAGANLRAIRLLEAHRQPQKLGSVFNDHKVFASVAFKYQPEDPDPATAAYVAHTMGFVPTTSGVGTGQAADPAKIAAMAGWGGADRRIALASGLDAENVHLYHEHVAYALVSTGISRDERIDFELLSQFMGRVRKLNAERKW